MSNVSTAPLPHRIHFLWTASSTQQTEGINFVLWSHPVCFEFAPQLFPFRSQSQSELIYCPQLDEYEFIDFRMEPKSEKKKTKLSSACDERTVACKLIAFISARPRTTVCIVCTEAATCWLREHKSWPPHQCTATENDTNETNEKKHRSENSHWRRACRGFINSPEIICVTRLALIPFNFDLLVDGHFDKAAGFMFIEIRNEKNARTAFGVLLTNWIRRSERVRFHLSNE